MNHDREQSDWLDRAPECLGREIRVCRDDLARQHGRARRLEASVDSAGGLLEWGRHYLSDYFIRPPSGMHVWLSKQLHGMHRSRGTKLNVLGPRGGAKSTIATLAYVLCVAVENLEPYIWIVSDTKHQARAHLENVRAELIDNRRLAEDYPAAVGQGPVWRSGQITLNNGVSIEAFGTGQRIRGRRRRADRPTLIVCDDLQNDGHMLSALARERSRAWFHGTLMKAGTSRTNLINLATALHREALAVQLSETPGWTSRTFRAVQRWPKNMRLWEEWEALYTDLTNARYRQTALRFYQQHRREMDAGAKLL